MNYTIQGSLQARPESEKVKVNVLVAWSSLTLNLTRCNLPGCSVHGILRQEHWSGLLCLPPGDLPHPGIELIRMQTYDQDSASQSQLFILCVCVLVLLQTGWLPLWPQDGGAGAPSCYKVKSSNKENLYSQQES